MMKPTVCFRYFANAPKIYSVSKNDTLNFNVLYCSNIYSVATTVWPKMKYSQTPTERYCLYIIICGSVPRMVLNLNAV
jgi:hypothetical protein